MARTDGIGRGFVHGPLIGAAALAGLSLAIPLRETQPPAEPTAPITAPSATAKPEPAAPPEQIVAPVQQPVGQAEDPAATPPQPATQLAPPTGSEFARAEDLPPTLPGHSSAPAMTSAVVEVAEPAAESLPQPTTGPANRPDAQNQTEMPRPADEAQIAVAAPQAETPQPVTQPIPVRLGQPAQDTGLAAASRAAPAAPDEAEDTALPAAESLPATALAQRPDAPVDAASPDPATIAEAAGGAPDAQTGTEATASPDEDTSTPPAAQQPETAPRVSAPVLETPDPRRESVPPPPAAAEEADDVAVLPDADLGTGAVEADDEGETDAAEPAAVSPEATEPPAVAAEPPVTAPAPVPANDSAAPSGTQGRPAPDLDIPALPLTSMP